MSADPVRTRVWGGAVSLVMLAAVAWPLARRPVPDDSFPLSTYPMFATRRPGAVVALDYVIATGPDGARRHVPPVHVGNAEVLQALMTVRNAVGRGQAGELCRAVAARVDGDPAFDAMDSVAVVAGRHEAVPYLTRGERGSEREHARCSIPRGRP